MVAANCHSQKFQEFQCPVHGFQNLSNTISRTVVGTISRNGLQAVLLISIWSFAFQ